MLDYASLEAGRVLLRRQPFDPRRLAAETVERYAVAARRRGVALSVFVAPDLPERLVGDPARLGQVMANLVSNAVRFTENGEAALRLFLSPSRDNLRPDARRRLLVHVRDTGIGIAEAQLEAVFAPFTQQDASSTRRFGGLGLGLAITRRLTALMEGNLCLTSREGEGTDVWLSLPTEDFFPAPSAATRTPGLPDGGPGA
jgi:signal transduction histidine kinase